MHSDENSIKKSGLELQENDRSKLESRLKIDLNFQIHLQNTGLKIQVLYKTYLNRTTLDLRKGFLN